MQSGAQQHRCVALRRQVGHDGADFVGSVAELGQCVDDVAAGGYVQLDTRTTPKDVLDLGSDFDDFQAESLERFSPVAEAARADGVSLRGYVSCVTDCPFEGRVAPAAVADMVRGLLSLGCREVSLGDTIGQGAPDRVGAMLDAVLDVCGPERLAGHFHDTGGRAMANIDVALRRGLRVFDAAAGGLGGCPFAPGAPGNVASEAVAARLSAMGFETGLDADLLDHAAAFARSLRSAP